MIRRCVFRVDNPWLDRYGKAPAAGKGWQPTTESTAVFGRCLAYNRVDCVMYCEIKDRSMLPFNMIHRGCFACSQLGELLSIHGRIIERIVVGRYDSTPVHHGKRDVAMDHGQPPSTNDQGPMTKDQ